jgi:ribosomal protein S18 acetylase RimI-like enzyme
MAPRPATPNDAAAIARVHVESWQGAYAHVFPAERLAGLSTDGRARWWRSQLADPPKRTRVLVDGDGEGAAGFASVGPSRDSDTDPARVGELYSIYVMPEQWGSGIGKGLMGAAVGALGELGFEEAVLWVLEDNPRARRFYEAAGWRLDGATKEDVFLGVGVTEVRYRIALEA